MNRDIGKCGDANPNGNISLFRKGACNEDLLLADAYRCTGCNSWFHKDCIFKHFELEKKHDWGRQKERKELIKQVDAIIYSSRNESVVREQWENFRTDLIYDREVK